MSVYGEVDSYAPSLSTSIFSLNSGSESEGKGFLYRRRKIRVHIKIDTTNATAPNTMPTITPVLTVLEPELLLDTVLKTYVGSLVGLPKQLLLHPEPPVVQEV